MEKVQTKQAPAALGPYSQAIVISENMKLIFVSGQLPLDPRTGELVAGDVRTMTRQVLDNIEAILLAGATNLYNVIRTEVFLTDLRDFSAMNEEYAKRFNLDLPPARQTIQVAALPKGSPIEISCIACIPKGDH